MSTHKTTWYKLICYWCQKRNPKGYGLTIPFIIGVEEKMTISQLLTAVKNSDYDYKVILRWCNDLNEYVLSIPDEYTNPFVDRMNGDKSLLYAEEELSSLSFNEVVRFIENKYSDIIERENYSKNMSTRDWEPFTKKDKILIQKALDS